MKERVLSLVFFLILLTSIASAEVSRTDDALIFDMAIGMLQQIDDRESVEEAQSLFSEITSKYNQSNLFAMYASAILNIYDEDFDEALTRIEVLEMKQDFVELLEEYGLQTANIMRMYIEGRRLEDSGDYQGALEKFAQMNFYDSADRMVELLSKAKEQRYSEAMDLYNAGEYARAAEAFAALDNYKDSVEMTEKAAALIPTPTPTPTSTPFGTESTSKMLEIKYDRAIKLFDMGDYEAAAELFESLGDYLDSSELAQKAISLIPTPAPKQSLDIAIDSNDNKGYEIPIIAPGKDFYYYDETGVLEQSLKGEIFYSNRLLYDSCGAQIVIVILETTGETSIDDYAYTLFNTWGIGDKTKNNGLLLILAIEDEDYYTRYGSGLNDLFTPSVIKHMYDEYLESDFAARNYSSGVRKFFEAAFKAVAEYYGADVSVNDGIMAYESYINAKTEETAEDMKNDTLEVVIDSDPASIRYVQEMLCSVGLLNEENINGIYDNVTTAAVYSFQEWVNSLREESTLVVTGYVDKFTRMYLEYAFDHELIVQLTPTTVPTQTPAAPAVVNVYEPISAISDAETVQQLQMRLYSLGLLSTDGLEPGALDVKTLEAVKEYQKYQNEQFGTELTVLDPFDPEAVVDAETLRVLFAETQ